MFLKSCNGIILFLAIDILNAYEITMLIMYLLALFKLFIYARIVWYVFNYLSRDLNQETAKGPFQSSSQAATYQSKHSKVKTIC